MKNLLVILTITLVAALAYYAGSQSIHQANVNDNNLVQQEKCANQARKAFEENHAGKKDPDSIISSTNHYNKKLNKCFLLDETLTNVQSAMFTGNLIYRFLVDAYEGKMYANLYSNVSDKAGFHLNQCNVILPSGENKQCNSPDEFDELIKYYMEQ